MSSKLPLLWSGSLAIEVRSNSEKNLFLCLSLLSASPFCILTGNYGCFSLRLFHRPGKGSDASRRGLRLKALRGI